MSGKNDLRGEGEHDSGGDGSESPGAEGGGPGKAGKRAQRESREASALRDNLRRRKAGARPKSSGSEPPSTEMPRHGGDGGR